jgi:hypothetical protein
MISKKQKTKKYPKALEVVKCIAQCIAIMII